MITLAHVTAADDDFLRSLYRTTREDELAMTGWSDAQKGDFIAQQFAAQSAHYARYPERDFNVIVVDGQRAGRLYLSRMGDELRVVDIALLPALRGRGIATALLTDLIARESLLGIHVEKENPALRLYQRLGFEIVEDKGVYWFLQLKTAS